MIHFCIFIRLMAERGKFFSSDFFICQFMDCICIFYITFEFRFPVYFGDRETQELCWDNESTVETVCLLGKRKPDATVKFSVDMDDYYRI